MSDYSLKPSTPLGGGEPRIDQVGDVQIVEICDSFLASIAMRNGKEKPFSTAAKKLFGFALPDVGNATAKGNWSAMWAAPEQWFIESNRAEHEDIAATLKSAFGESASITEQSGGWCRFDLDGATCVAMMERLCNVDLQIMQSDQATRSVVEHIGVFIVCRENRTSFSIYGPRSSAGSLHHALMGAAKSVA